MHSPVGISNCAPATLREPLKVPPVVARSILYRGSGEEICPSCGNSHWHVGRFSAECAFCAEALPFAGSEAARDVLKASALTV